MSESNKAINQTAAFDPRSEWFENADIAMVIIDPAVAAIVSVNAAAARLFDQSGAFDAIPLDPILSIPREDLLELLCQASEAGVLELRDRHAPYRDGRRELEFHGGALDWNGKRCLFATVHDPSETHMANGSGDGASLDALTRIPNRELFCDRLAQTLARARRADERFAVLVLGLDRFGGVNEMFGHATGDELLRVFAERMRGFVRETDTVARLGSDQFVVLVTGLQDAAHSVILAQKILRSLANAFEVAGQEIRVTASIGIALYHPDLPSPEDYVDRACRAMDVAKEEGRNTYRLHTETLDELFRSEVAIGTDLHHALEDEDLEVYFQPQVDLRTNQVVGLEALARWSHPRRGAVEPTEFIPVAERTNLIIPLGNWILQAACRQARIWPDDGLLPETLAINLSPLQFKDQSLVAQVRSALGDYGVPPERIELEITESVVMESMGVTMRPWRGCDRTVFVSRSMISGPAIHR